MADDFNRDSQDGNQGLPNGTTPLPSDNPNGQSNAQPAPGTAPAGQAQQAPSADGQNWQNSPEYRAQQAQRDREIAQAKREADQYASKLAAIEEEMRRRDEVYRSSLPEDQRQEYDSKYLETERARLAQEKAEWEFQRSFAPIQEKANQVLGEYAQHIDWNNPMNAISQVLDAPQVGQMGYQPLNPTGQYAAPVPPNGNGGMPVQGQGGYPSQPQDQMYQQVMGMVRDAMTQMGANAVDLGGGASAPSYQDMGEWQKEYNRLRQEGNIGASIQHLAYKPQ